MIVQILLNQIMNRHIEVLRLLQDIARIRKCLCHNGVQHNVRSRNRIAGSKHTELKLVTGKGKRACAVSVGCILREVRKRADTCLEFSALQGGGCIAGLHQLRDDVLKLIAQEHGNNRWRRLICAKALVISCVSCGLSEQICMLINRLQNAGEYQQELDVLVRRLTWIKQVDPIISHQGPVVVLAGAIDPCKRFLVKQASHMMFCRDSFERLHHDVVVVNSQGCILIDDCQLMLCRGHLIVLGLCRDTKLPEFLIDIPHERRNSLAEGSEVVVIQLLPLRRHRPEQGSACVDEILSLLERVLVNQEILLLWSDGRRHFFGLVVSEEPQQPERLCIDRIH